MIEFTYPTCPRCNESDNLRLDDEWGLCLSCGYEDERERFEGEE